VQLAQVDNFFRFASSQSKAKAALARLTTTFDAVGIPLHEIQLGQQFTALGWHWNCKDMTMCITEDKLGVMRTKLASWASATHLGGKEIESVTGLLCFLADGCEASRPFVGSFYGLREAARKIARASNTHMEDVRVKVPVGSECSEALKTVSEIYASWDGLCSIVGDFSPTAFAEGIGFTDASTSDGYGGIAYTPIASTMLPAGVISGFCGDYPPDVREEAKVTDRESTAYYEAFAILRWLEIFGHKYKGKRVLLFCDSKSALGGIARAFSSVPRLQRIIKRVRVCLAALHITLRASYVHTSRNTCADCLSHGRLEEAKQACLKDFGLQLTLLVNVSMP
jgi:hypothetical protein